MSRQEDNSVYINGHEIVDAELIGCDQCWEWQQAAGAEASERRRAHEEIAYLKSKFEQVRRDLEEISYKAQKLRNKL